MPDQDNGVPRDDLSQPFTVPGTRNPTGECDCCGYGPTEVMYRQRPGREGYDTTRDHRDRHWWLCTICRRTYIANAQARADHQAELYVAVAWIGNYLADLVAGKVARGGPNA